MTTVLLDTHVFLWLQTTPERLSSTLELLADDKTVLLSSAASSREISVKWSIGRLELPEPPSR